MGEATHHVPPRRTGARGSIVAISDAETRRSAGRLSVPGGPQAGDGDGLDHVSLPCYQHIDTLAMRRRRARGPCNLDVVSDVTVRRCLSRSQQKASSAMRRREVLSVRSGEHMPRFNRSLYSVSNRQ